jgi:hypothetical protein
MTRSEIGPVVSLALWRSKEGDRNTVMADRKQ